MKKIIVYWDEGTGSCYQDANKLWHVGLLDSTSEIELAKETIGVSSSETPSNEVVVKLVTAGMSAEDIVKLKHGGVL
jgi:hypothetical protein